ncbi:MAG: hypothetical protein IPO92_20995 [Saprospiraceae bacterium]|nr:hypothetical protein [Saprospiraceae bacterium]
MKHFFYFFVLFMIFSGYQLQSQNISPVKWHFELNKLSETDYELVATANMQKSWVLYSQFTDDNGPVPTQFIVDEKIMAMAEKSKAIKEHDDMFDVDVIKFKEKAIFIAKIKKENRTGVQGYVTFMTCDGSKCLPPTDASFDLKF